MAGASASPATLRLVDREMRRVVNDAHATATSPPDRAVVALGRLAQALLERESLDEGDAYAAARVARAGTDPGPHCGR